MYPAKSNENNDNKPTTRTVFIAGATGYLGRHVVAEYHKRGWNVMALSRRPVNDFPEGVTVVLGDPCTKPESIRGCMMTTNGQVDLVVSCLGITRQRDGLTYHDVDYQANANLLDEAIRSGVDRFAYVHVLHGDEMTDVEMAVEKQRFVDLLTSETIKSTVICPSGFFSDMKDFLDMARSGRVWLFGDGQKKINPIHGADLAAAMADVIQEGKEQVNVGGPQVFSHTQLAELAFECLEKTTTPRISYLWDWIRTVILKLVTWFAPQTVRGPAQFFLTAFGKDMEGEKYGSRTLKEHWMEILESPSN